MFMYIKNAKIYEKKSTKLNKNLFFYLAVNIFMHEYVNDL